MYVCMYICMYIRICTHVRTYMYVCTYVYVHMYVHICMYVHMYVYACIHVYTYVCVQCVETFSKDTSWEFQYCCLLDDYYSLRLGCILPNLSTIYMCAYCRKGVQNFCSSSTDSTDPLLQRYCK